MSIKINAFCRKDRIATDQTTILYLRFTIHRKSRYVSTGIRIPVAQWNFESQPPQPSAQHLLSIYIFHLMMSRFIDNVITTKVKNGQTYYVVCL